MKKFIILTLSFFIIGAIFYALVFNYQLSSVDKFSKEGVMIEIKEGDGFSEIANGLAEENLVRSETAFKLYLLLRGWAGELNTGTFYLSKNLNSYEVARKIAKEEGRQILITIPEGWTMAKIQKELLDNNIMSAVKIPDFIINDFSDKFEFLKDIPADRGLEGFLFPDTYYFRENFSAEEIVEKFLENFRDKVLKLVAGERDNLWDTIRMASLVESEVPAGEDRDLVSSVLWRRIKIGMPLQVDISIVYEKCNIRKIENNCRKLSKNDLVFDSPYNTYLYKELPWGPVSNPGFSAISASLRPQKTSYLYYLSDPETRKTIFSETLEQHNTAKWKYLR